MKCRRANQTCSKCRRCLSSIAAALGEVPTTPADGYADGGGAAHHHNPGRWPVLTFASRIDYSVEDGRFRRRRFLCSGVLRRETGRSQEYRAIVLYRALGWQAEAVIAGAVASSQRPLASGLSASRAIWAADWLWLECPTGRHSLLQLTRGRRRFPTPPAQLNFGERVSSALPVASVDDPFAPHLAAIFRARS